MRVLDMSVVRGIGGVCDMCICLARGGVGGVGDERVRGLGLWFTNPRGTWESRMCLCFGYGGVGGVGGGGVCVVEWVGGLCHDMAGWGDFMSLCVVSMDVLW